jgi:F-type H+-transporting ATPase subunit gamma
LPDFSLEATELMAALVRQYLFISLYRACAEAQAAEYSQRLLAMQLAERNIDQRIEELTRTYHQLRQEKITAELLEIVSGFEAVHGE